MIACELCTGSRYLGDNQSLGRCVCVTPENMLSLEKARDEATEPWKALETVSRLSEADLDAAYETLLEGEQDAIRDAAVRWADVVDGETARLALQAYLQSIGLPAVPAGALGNPALEALVNLLME